MRFALTLTTLKLLLPHAGVPLEHRSLSLPWCFSSIFEQVHGQAVGRLRYSEYLNGDQPVGQAPKDVHAAQWDGCEHGLWQAFEALVQIVYLAGVMAAFSV